MALRNVRTKNPNHSINEIEIIETQSLTTELKKVPDKRVVCGAGRKPANTGRGS